MGSVTHKNAIVLGCGVGVRSQCPPASLSRRLRGSRLPFPARGRELDLSGPSAPSAHARPRPSRPGPASPAVRRRRARARGNDITTRQSPLREVSHSDGVAMEPRAGSLPVLPMSHSALCHRRLQAGHPGTNLELHGGSRRGQLPPTCSPQDPQLQGGVQGSGAPPSPAGVQSGGNRQSQPRRSPEQGPLPGAPEPKNTAGSDAATEKGAVQQDHATPRGDGSRAAQGVRNFSVPVGLDSSVHVDLVVVGSVAVSEKGWRIGKGEGYADLEYAMMVSMGAVCEGTPVVTTVHDCQVLDFPEALLEDHDLTVDYILTPTRVIATGCERPKPVGITWSKISPEMLERIPVLRSLRERERRAGKDVSLWADLPHPAPLCTVVGPQLAPRPGLSVPGAASGRMGSPQQRSHAGQTQALRHRRL
ncbi:methenyltetrahydrofolate synthase domain-containing protein isoform X2 [Heterocephalus glaber]|uniref:Methenyltetrahydrofolate synthase domain-containing protein isoform X2 n=1 Tax=Heterocephalus glaber TaxID=10181 RepID=A0AAX6STU9_HETGA|nr:methenyltetrahydrofolate synthase domain-containing protein isoform X2 [Heterocephalus glaber]